MLQSLLEGCSNPEIPRIMTNVLDLNRLVEKLEQIYKKSQIDSSEDESELGFDIFILFKTLNSFDTSKKLEGMMKVYDEMYAYYSQRTGSIEISRENKIERVYFKIPSVCGELDHESKEKLLLTVDRSRQTSKLQDFCDRSQISLSEMEFQQSRKSTPSLTPRILGWNPVLIGNLSFLFSVFINILLLRFYQYDSDNQ